MASFFQNDPSDRLRSQLSADNIVGLGMSPSTTNAIFNSQQALGQDLERGARSALMGSQEEETDASTQGRQLTNKYSAGTLQPRIQTANSKLGAENIQAGNQQLELAGQTPTAFGIGTQIGQTRLAGASEANIRAQGTLGSAARVIPSDVGASAQDASTLAEIRTPTAKIGNLEEGTEAMRLANEASQRDLGEGKTSGLSPLKQRDMLATPEGAYAFYGARNPTTGVVDQSLVPGLMEQFMLRSAGIRASAGNANEAQQLTEHASKFEAEALAAKARVAGLQSTLNDLASLKSFSKGSAITNTRKLLDKINSDPKTAAAVQKSFGPDYSKLFGGYALTNDQAGLVTSTVQGYAAESQREADKLSLQADQNYLLSASRRANAYSNPAEASRAYGPLAQRYSNLRQLDPDLASSFAKNPGPFAQVRATPEEIRVGVRQIANQLWSRDPVSQLPDTEQNAARRDAALQKHYQDAAQALSAGR